MSEPDSASPSSSRTMSWTYRMLFVGTLLLFVAIFGGILSSCIPARAVARAFLAALHEGRIDDARALASGPLQVHLVLDTPVATPSIDPPRTIAFIRAAKRVDIDGLVQFGFSDSFSFFTCFDAKLDDAAVFWIVMRKTDGAWRVEALASDRPKVCDGSD